MKAITRQIPNLFSLLNLLSGSAAIVSLLTGMYSNFLPLLIACLLFDFMDGLTARWLDAGSELGEQLDSLADMVSFGFLPGVIMYILLSNAWLEQTELITTGFQWKPVFGFLITAFSALRLARFNLSKDSKSHFTGLASPSNTFFIAGLFFIALYGQPHHVEWLLQPWLLMVITLIFSFLLILPIRMFSLKFKRGDRKGNIQGIIAIFAGVAGLLILGAYGPSVVVLLYILYNVGKNLLVTNTKEKIV